MWTLWLPMAFAAPAVRGPRADLVPPEVQACRDRGFLWLSDPDYFERTEILEVAGSSTAEGRWRPVWQILDQHQGRSGYLLVYPDDCRVVVAISTPVEGAEPVFQLVPPQGSTVTAAEEEMLRNWARRW